MKKHFLFAVAFLAFATAGWAQKKAIDQSVYDGWKSTSQPIVSDDGTWISYVISPQRGDGVLEFYNTATGQTTRKDRGSAPEYFNNGQWVMYKVKVQFDTLRQAKINKVKDDQMPKDTFAIVNLSTMNTSVFPKAKSLKVSEKGSIVAYTYEIVPQKDTTDSSKKTPKKYDRLVIYDVAAADSVTVDSVKSFALAKTGNLIVYTKEADSLKSVYTYVKPSGKPGVHTQLLSEKLGTIDSKLAIDENGSQLAFLYTPDTVKHAIYNLYYASTKNLNAVQLAKADEVGMPSGYAVSKFGNLYFNREGNRLQFSIAPKPKETPKDSLPKDEKYSLDLWSWQDTLIQPQQIVQKKRIAEASYTAVYYPAENKWVALEDYNLPNVIFPQNENARYGLGVTSRPYAYSSTWDSNNGNDLYRVDLRTGERTLTVENAYGANGQSPSGNYQIYYRPQDDAYYAVDVRTMEHRNISAGIPYPLYNEDHDSPQTARPYYIRGWSKDEKLLIADRYDIWMLDPSGKNAPQNITRIGRQNNTTFSVVFLAKEDGKRLVDLSKDILLLAFNQQTKQSGYYSLRVGSEPQRLIEGPYRYNFLANAKGADRLVFARESFTEFRDLWTSNTRFQQPVKITNANPQQSQYKWGSVQMMSWVDLNGDEIQGLLYLPEDYDPSKKYPTIVYFYETHTDNLHQYHQPQPSWSIIIPTVCTSNDYVVFTPDIKYRTGYPGQSCYDAVMSGTLALIERGIADKDRIALQGQSWGGYQIAWLVTQTDLFKCCAPGAPVSNMTSAYGGIRWGSGMARSFQYEHTQSRIGATPWERRDLYIDNSPLFFADKMNTPMLMRHDDADEAVPWYQGIEYYVALRRLGKPVWMLNYNDEPHNLRSRAARMDWDKRMMQFFDHYLKDAPAPRWLVEGISQQEKGIDHKYELINVEL